MAGQIKLDIECTSCGAEDSFQGTRDDVHRQREQFQEQHRHGGRESTTWTEENV